MVGILYTIVQLLAVFGLVCGILMFWSNRTLPIVDVKTLPLLSIIIPARNEEQRLPPLLQSLQAQSWQHFEVLVVDDGSTDQTAEVASFYGARVLKSKQLAQQSQGKSGACAYGAQCAKGEWLLFLDADVQLIGHDSLIKLMTSFTRQNCQGILSVQPYHQIVKRYENLSVIFNMIVITGMNVFTIWQHKLPTAGSFGPCILCDKKSYRLTGGHEAAEHSIMDDFALSAVFFAKDLAVTNYLGRGIIQMRMYEEGVQQLVEGWTKNLATASRSTHKLVMLLIQLWIFGIIMAAIAPVMALFVSSTACSLSIIIYVVYGAHSYMLARRVGNFSWILILTYPLFVLFFTAVFCYSLFCTHVLGVVMWKGRKIKV